jgi:hypothetical protein
MCDLFLPGRSVLLELKVRGLETRFFGSVDQQGSDVQLTVGDALAREDQYLASANLCRWVLNFDDIHVGKQVSPPPSL